MQPIHPPHDPNTPPYLPTPADYNALVHFRRNFIEGPTLVYITVDDNFLVEMWQPLANSSFALTLRLLTPGGQVIPIQYSFPLPGVFANPSPFTKLIPGVEGYLVSATVTSNAVSPGLTFVRLTVQRGQGSGDTARGLVLLQGYTSIYEDLAWPNGVPTSPLGLRGFMRSSAGVIPAPGAEQIDTVPVNVNWILLTAVYSLTTSAAVANRFSHLVIDDGANIIFQGVNGTAQTAGTTFTYTWAAGLQNATDGLSAIQGGLPVNLRLKSGYRIRTVTTALQAADQYSGARYYVEEFSPAN